MTKATLIEDKNRMDKICDDIAFKRKLKTVTIFYWEAVAIGHLLEWIVNHKRSE